MVSLTMKKILSVIVSLTMLMFVAPQAAATTTTPTGTITGRVESTWKANGGASVLGDPVGTETKIYAYGRNTYHQHTTKKATVYWDGSQGGRVWLSGKLPGMGSVSSERDALARSGFRPNVLYRSAKLCDASTNTKRLITAVMHGGLIIDLRTSGTCSEPSFPSVVAKQRISISGHADYSRYVTGSTERTQFGKALIAIANKNGPVWVHCTKGKDRTGWLVAMTMFALGADESLAKAEYMRTTDASTTRWNSGMDAIEARYPSTMAYVKASINQAGGDPDAIVAKLVNKLG